MTVFQYNGCFSAAKDPLPLAEQVMACFYRSEIRPVIGRTRYRFFPKLDFAGR